MRSRLVGVTKELRIRERRRGFESAHSFPFTDVAGQLVNQDRRIMPDRRLNNIQLEMIPFPSVDAHPASRH